MASIVCTNCGAEGESNFSTNYFGELVCELCGTQSYLQSRTETQDAEDMGLDLLALQKMKRRTKRKKRERKVKQIVEKRPVQLIECIATVQYILNDQAEALVQIGFPPEYPRAVRDVWFHFLHVWPVKSTRPLLRCFTEFFYNRKAADKKMDPAVTNEVLEQWDEENARELERIFQPSQTIPEDDELDEPRPRSKTKVAWPNRKKAQHTLDWFRIRDTIAILVIAGRMLNVAALPCDYIEWIKSGELPYHNVLSRCPIELQESVESVAVFFDSSVSRNWVSPAAIAVRAHYVQYHLEIQLPPLNASLIAFNICENLGLPPQVFRNFQWITTQLNTAGTILEAPIQNRWITKYQDKRGSALDSAAGIAAFLLCAIRLCPNWMEWIYEHVQHKEQHGVAFSTTEADALPRRDLGAFVEYAENLLIKSNRGRIPEDFACHVEELKSSLSNGKAYHFRRDYESHALLSYPAEHEDGICIETDEDINRRIDHAKRVIAALEGADVKVNMEEVDRVAPEYFYPVYRHRDRVNLHAPFEAALQIVSEYVDVPMGVVLLWVDVLDKNMRDRMIEFMDAASGVEGFKQGRSVDMIKIWKERRSRATKKEPEANDHGEGEEEAQGGEEEEDETKVDAEEDDDDPATHGEVEEVDMEARTEEEEEEKEDEESREADAVEPLDRLRDADEDETASPDDIAESD